MKQLFHIHARNAMQRIKFTYNWSFNKLLKLIIISLKEIILFIFKELMLFYKFNYYLKKLLFNLFRLVIIL